jgi:hypothetical protein
MKPFSTFALRRIGGGDMRRQYAEGCLVFLRGAGWPSVTRFSGSPGRDTPPRELYFSRQGMVCLCAVERTRRGCPIFSSLN